MKRIIKSSELENLVNEKYDIHGFLNDDVLGKFEWSFGLLSTHARKFKVEAFFEICSYELCAQYKTDVYELRDICYSPTFMGRQDEEEFLAYTKQIKAAEYISQTIKDTLNQYYIING